MRSIHVKASRGYDVIIGEGILNKVGEIVADLKDTCTAVIITDDNVAPLYLENAKNSLLKAGFSVKSFIFPHSERSKNISVLSEILEFLAGEHITRSDMLVALGGGVTGDIVGFAASIYLRGIDFVQIPTSLLAAVDSSVGGKTAVNLTAGKNLAGSFYQPIAVICDYLCFKTLPSEFISDGTAEIIKYGMIQSPKLLDILENKKLEENYEEIISHCVEIKSNIVMMDEFDKGERQLLNFGHTIGHAIEKISEFSVMHGHGVAIGMAYISKIAINIGYCHEDFSKRFSKLLEKYNLSAECDYSPKEVYEASLGDKKRSGDKITLVMPERWGNCSLNTIKINEFEKMFYP